MSFTKDVKQEISLLTPQGDDRKAQLSALIQACASLCVSSQGMYLSVSTENAAVSRCIYRLIKDSYKIVQIEPMVRRKMNLRKNLVYILRIYGPITNILRDLKLYSARGLRDRPLKVLVAKESCARCYLRGAFMAEGSVNSPSTSSYHLEIKSANMVHADFLVELMARFYIEGRIVQRRTHRIVYIKAAEKIGDFLRVIGADQHLLLFENERISRDLSNNIQRLNNVDVANEVKSLQASNRQLEDIRILESHMHMGALDEKLREVVLFRKRYPDATLHELSDKMWAEAGIKVSKSGLKHRFVRIEELADRVRKVHTDIESETKGSQRKKGGKRND